MGYADQWQRVQRWLERIEAAPRNSTEYDDFVWAFFQNCWHMRDWIANDQQLPEELRHRVPQLAMKQRSLKICADLANATKHFELRHPKVGSGAKHSHRVLTVVAGESSKTKIDYYVALDDGQQISTLDVAREAVDVWRRLLVSEGLPA